MTPTRSGSSASPPGSRRSPGGASPPVVRFWKTLAGLVAITVWWLLMRLPSSATDPEGALRHSSPSPVRPVGPAGKAGQAWPQTVRVKTYATARQALLTGTDRFETQPASLEAAALALPLEEAYAMLERLAIAAPSPQTEEMSRLLLRRLALADVGTLEAWARNLPEQPLRIAAFQAVALRHCQLDTSIARKWAQALGGSPAEVAATIQVATEINREAPVAALTLAGRLPASPERNRCLVDSVAHWATSAPQSATEWAAAVPDEALRAQLLARAAIAMADTDPATAARWVANHVPPGPQQANAATAVAQRWAQQNPTAAQLWVESFSDVPLRTAALEAIRQTAR